MTYQHSSRSVAVVLASTAVPAHHLTQCALAAHCFPCQWCCLGGVLLLASCAGRAMPRGQASCANAVTRPSQIWKLSSPCHPCCGPPTRRWGRGTLAAMVTSSWEQVCIITLTLAHMNRHVGVWTRQVCLQTTCLGSGNSTTTGHPLLLALVTDHWQ